MLMVKKEMKSVTFLSVATILLVCMIGYLINSIYIEPLYQNHFPEESVIISNQHNMELTYNFVREYEDVDYHAVEILEQNGNLHPMDKNSAVIGLDIISRDGDKVTSNITYIAKDISNNSYSSHVSKAILPGKLADYIRYNNFFLRFRHGDLIRS